MGVQTAQLGSGQWFALRVELEASTVHYQSKLAW